MGRILGIDYGKKRIGLALSDPGKSIARPLAVLRGEEELLARLEDLLEEQEVERIVLGLPRNMDGTLGPKAKEVLRFKERLEACAGAVPVVTWDERLTSVQAERFLVAGGITGRRRKERVDKVAAQILLQSYLDSLRAGEDSEAGGEDARGGETSQGGPEEV